MSATTSLYIDSYNPKTNGECAISVRVIFERKRKYYKTGISAPVVLFEKSQGNKPRGECKELSLRLHSFEKKAADIIRSLPTFTFEAFERQFYTNRGTNGTLQAAFVAYTAELREAGRIGTAVSYECAQTSLENFAPGARFADVTSNFLRKYEAWMLDKGKSITTVGIYLRSLRTIFNIAIAEGLLTKEYYPFGRKKYEIPTANNIKKALTMKDIEAIFNYKPEPGTMAERAKDYWRFMYLCNGMNVKDMCLLKYENVTGNVLEFIRAKTARTKRRVEPIRVTITRDVKAIIESHGNKPVTPSTFIFPVLMPGITPERERQLIQQLTGVINDHMKAIAKILNISSDCTTYAARHSFSTILQRSGVSTGFISEALGHSNVKTTANYLAGFEDEKKREIANLLTAFQ